MYVRTALYCTVPYSASSGKPFPVLWYKNMPIYLLVRLRRQSDRCSQLSVGIIVSCSRHLYFCLRRLEKSVKKDSSKWTALIAFYSSVFHSLSWRVL
jgi:hypothetical protein